MQALQAQMQALQSQPTWEDAVALMRQDGPRGFRIDIETDSTISGDVQAEQQGMTELLTGVTAFITGIGPAVESGIVPVDVAKSMLLATVRRYQMGKQIEDAIDQIGENMPPKQPPGPDPKIQAAQLDNDFDMKDLAFRQQQATEQRALDARRLALEERKQEMEEKKATAAALLEKQDLDQTHQRERDRLNLDGMTALHNAAAANAQQHLENAKAVSEHMQGMVEQFGKLHGAMEKTAGETKQAASAPKRVSIHRDPATKRIASLVIEHLGETPPTIQ